MDRAEATGFGVAAAGHLALLAALTLGFANAVHPPILNQPMEVEIVDAVALESMAASPAQVEPAPRLAEAEGPVEPAPPLPLPLPDPAPLPEPKAAEPPPRPKPVPAPSKAKPKPPEAEASPPRKSAPPAKAAPAKAAPAEAPPAKAKAEAKSRPTGRLTGILAGIGDRESKSRSTATPAAKAGPAAQASLAGAIRRQLKPHWKAPTGADAEQLRTVLEVRLARDGSIIGQPRLLSQTGLTGSNRSQAGLHEEQAIKAVRLAAPFDLPAEYYDAWKVIRPGFDKRLSQ